MNKTLSITVAVLLMTAGFLVLDVGSSPLPTIPNLTDFGTAVYNSDAASECSQQTVIGTDVVPDSAFPLVRLGNGIVRYEVCKAGSVILMAYGTTLNGIGPHVVIAENTQLHWEGYIDSPVSLSIPVGGPGWLSVGFVNDAASPSEDRNLYLTSISFVQSR